MIRHAFFRRFGINSEGKSAMSSSLSYKRNVKLAIVSLAILLFGVSLISRKAGASAFGPTPSNTNAPGEGNCTACHDSYAVNSGIGNVTITGLPKTYLPNQVVPLTVTVNEVGAVIYGFQLTSIDGVGRPAGTLLNDTSQSDQMQVVYGIVGPNVREYIEHTIQGVTPTVLSTKSWSFNWKAPANRVGRIGLYSAGNAADSSGAPSGDYIYTTSASINNNSMPSNFDADGRSDLSVFRPSNGAWYTSASSNGAFTAQVFGVGTDKLVPGDFDGDFKHDVAVFRPTNGTWYIWRSSNGAFSADAFGANGDVPAIGDFDGDGKSDLTVFRPSNGTWYSLRSSDGGLTIVQFGSSGDKPVAGDYDADGKTDIAVYRPGIGAWYLLRSSDGAFIGQQFGVSTDRPVQGDYDGDGKTDVAVYRPSNGTWYIQQSTAGFAGYAFGISTDIPAPGDFDGDGKTDITVFRNGTWYVLLSTNGSLRVDQFGATGDITLPSAYVPE
jgi:hypothetical protein